MGMSSDEAEVRELLKAHGEFVRHAQHGDMWRVPGGIVQLSGSPGDYRVWKNTLADVRRTLRLGRVPGFFEEERHVEPTNGSAQVAHPLDLGIKVDSKTTRTVLVDERHRIDLGPHQVWALLKLAGHVVPVDASLAFENGYVSVSWGSVREEVEES